MNSKSLREAGRYKFSITDHAMHGKLKKRRKGEHLKLEARIYLTKIIAAYPDDHREIQRVYKLSSSTLRRLKKNVLNGFKEYESAQTAIYKKEVMNRHIVDSIREVVEPPKPPLTLRAIHEKVLDSTGMDIKLHKLRKYLKSDLNFSFIKGSSRTPAVVEERYLLVKAFYGGKFLKQIVYEDFIVNIDESSFDRSLKKNYSWLPAGRGGSILHRDATGKTNLLHAVGVDGSWVSLIKDETISSKEFGIFLALLAEIIERKMQEEGKTLHFLADNARTHMSASTTKFTEELPVSMSFLPAYSPELAPVEQGFKAAKEIMKTWMGAARVDFSKESAAKNIIKAVNEINKSFIWHAWQKTIENAKSAVIQILKKNSFTGNSEENS